MTGDFEEEGIWGRLSGLFCILHPKGIRRILNRPCIGLPTLWNGRIFVDRRRLRRMSLCHVGGTNNVSSAKFQSQGTAAVDVALYRACNARAVGGLDIVLQAKISES